MRLIFPTVTPSSSTSRIRSSRRLERIREVLDDGASVGKIKRITSAFSFCAPEEFYTGNIRAQRAMEPAGCLGDLGWYCLRLVSWEDGSLDQSPAGFCAR